MITRASGSCGLLSRSTMHARAQDTVDYGGGATRGGKTLTWFGVFYGAKCHLTRCSFMKHDVTREGAIRLCHALRPDQVEWQSPRACRPKSLYTRKALNADINRHSGSRSLYTTILQVLFTFTNKYKFSKSLSIRFRCATLIHLKNIRGAGWVRQVILSKLIIHNHINCKITMLYYKKMVKLINEFSMVHHISNM
jgi:hypothetical protein